MTSKTSAPRFIAFNCGDAKQNLGNDKKSCQISQVGLQISFRVLICLSIAFNVIEPLTWNHSIYINEALSSTDASNHLSLICKGAAQLLKWCFFGETKFCFIYYPFFSCLSIAFNFMESMKPYGIVFTSIWAWFNIGASVSELNRSLISGLQRASTFSLLASLLAQEHVSEQIIKLALHRDSIFTEAITQLLECTQN